MAAVIHAGLCGGKHTVIICGGDIPGITETEVESAMSMLAADHAGASPKLEMVLGPAADGGYYLVGITSLGREQGPRSLTEYKSLFSSEAIEWGTGAVRAQQLARAAEVSCDNDDDVLIHDLRALILFFSILSAIRAQERTSTSAHTHTHTHTHTHKLTQITLACVYPTPMQICACPKGRCCSRSAARHAPRHR
jgi:hypothetical protein